MVYAPAGGTFTVTYGKTTILSFPRRRRRGNGPNQPISADLIEKVLDSDQIKTLMAHTGLSRDDLLAALSQHLPGVVNELTPQGRAPSAQEVSHLMQ